MCERLRVHLDSTTRDHARWSVLETRHPGRGLVWGVRSQTVLSGHFPTAPPRFRPSPYARGNAHAFHSPGNPAHPHKRAPPDGVLSR